jgi:DNA repair exonuclease SbcCD nuclease subunit
MSIKILATGDLHIGKRVSGLSENAPVFSAKDTWKRIVAKAIESRVDIVALTGDIVDKDNKYFEAIGALQHGFAQLKENGIRVYMVAGNHDFDVLPQIIRTGNFDNVHLLGANGEWELQEYTKGKESLQLVGWSFTTLYVTIDPLLQFNPAIINPEIPSIGLLHGEVDVPGSNYAPILLNNFKNIPVGTWILGHIHKPSVLHPNTPHIRYPGSPLAFSAKETGFHAPLIFTVENGMIGEPEPAFASSVRFEILEIDVSGANIEDLVRSRMINGITEAVALLEQELQGVNQLVYDVTLTGHHSNISQLDQWSLGLVKGLELTMGTGTSIVVRKVIVSVSPEINNLEELAAQSTPVGILAKIILSIERDEEDEFLTALLENWKTDYLRINMSATYSPLMKTGIRSEDLDKTGKQYIKKESARLLGELLKQNKP